MSLVDRHIFLSWLRAFLLALGAVLGVIILWDVSDNLKDLLDYRAGLADVLRFYLVRLPGFLPSILPLTLLLSLLFSLGQLHRTGEITALRTAGLSLSRITRSLWLAAALLGAGLYQLNARLIPWSVEEARRLRQEYQFAHELRTRSADEVGLLYNLAFHNQAEGRLWFINRFSQYHFRAFGVTIAELGPDRREVARWNASEGFYDERARRWELLRGRLTEFDPSTGEAIRSVPFERRLLPRFQEDPILMKALEDRPQDLSRRELDRILRELPPSENPEILPYAVRAQALLTSPVICLVVASLAIPFAVTGVRVNPLVGMSKSIGLFGVYYALTLAGHLAGSHGVLSPAVAAWAPLALMLLPAAWFLHRAR